MEFKTLRRGEVIEGTVMGIQRDGVLVDLGSKSEGFDPGERDAFDGGGPAEQGRGGRQDPRVHHAARGGPGSGDAVRRSRPWRARLACAAATIRRRRGVRRRGDGLQQGRPARQRRGRARIRAAVPGCGRAPGAGGRGRTGIGRRQTAAAEGHRDQPAAEPGDPVRARGAAGMAIAAEGPPARGAEGRRDPQGPRLQRPELRRVHRHGRGRRTCAPERSVVGPEQDAGGDVSHRRRGRRLSS